MPYAPTLESLRTHPVPRWYEDAKLGIFIHWSVSSVPAFAPREAGIEEIFAGRSDQRDSPYTEWYWNSLRLEGSAVARHHRERYGEQPYEAFAEVFRRGLAHWDPQAWAHAFEQAGARYVVLVTKHHDGFCLWPSQVAHPDPRRAGWNTGRDVVGELAAAVRARGLRFGVYYSGGLDWTFDARPIRGLVDVLAAMPGGAYPEYAAAQVRELVERYRPDVLWNDISWPQPVEALCELVSDYYAAVPEGVINDRWLPRTRWIPLLRLRPVNRLAELLVKRELARRGGMLALPAPPLCDFRTPEYARFDRVQSRKWECVRGMDKSFGYNAASRPEDFIAKPDLLHSFVDIVSKNGNLLLNVGPRGVDARIPEPQLERLRWLGDFLAAHGQAIYATRPCPQAEGTSQDGTPLRYTQRDGTVYEIALDEEPCARAMTRQPADAPSP